MQGWISAFHLPVSSYLEKKHKATFTLFYVARKIIPACSFEWAALCMCDAKK